MHISSIEKNRGVTLVEMSFVLLIVVVIVSMAFFTYKVYSGKPKNLEAALLAHEIKQDINLQHQTKRLLPKLYVLSHVSRGAVSGAEVIRDGNSGVRVNVYLNSDPTNRPMSNQVYSLYGSLVDDQLAWEDCGDDCVLNAVDIPPAAPVPPASGVGNNGASTGTGSHDGNGDSMGGGSGDGDGDGGIHVVVAPPEPPAPPVTPVTPTKPEKPKYKVFTSRNNAPIWNDRNDAQNNCPQRCANEGGQWTGGWWTTEWSKHSVCQCKQQIN